MSIIIFIIVLALLIFVHELGHFIAAKKSGIKVDEFGIGFPPRAIRLFKKGETDYTLNWIPFGGFVKIFGETPDQESIEGPDKERSFVNKPKWIQAIVLVAGVAFNMLLAWILISIGFMIGLPTPADYPTSVELKNVKTTLLEVMENSPAERAGLQVGDKINSITAVSKDETVSNPTPKEFSEITQNAEEVSITYQRGKEVETISIPSDGYEINGEKAIGVSLNSIGILKLDPLNAIWTGAITTVSLTKVVAVGLGNFLVDIFTGNSDFSQVSGPVGIVGLVGSASELGFVYLLSFVALISIHLAIINLFPFPALDGGRLLFVLIETVTRKTIPPKVANTVNAAGFVLLLILMVVVTYNDIIKLF